MLVLGLFLTAGSAGLSLSLLSTGVVKTPGLIDLRVYHSPPLRHQGRSLEAGTDAEAAEECVFLGREPRPSGLSHLSSPQPAFLHNAGALGGTTLTERGPDQLNP